MDKMNKKIMMWILGVILLIVLAIWTGLDGMREVFKVVELDKLLLFLISLSLLQVLTLSLTTYQWYYLINKFEKLSFLNVFLISLTGNFVESVTPSSKLGGESVKIYLFKQKTDFSYQKLTTFLLAHKYVLLSPFLIICLISLVVASLRYNVPQAVYVSFTILTVSVGTLIAVIYLGRDDNSKAKSRYFVIRKLLEGIDFIKKSAAEVNTVLSKTDRNKLFMISFLIWGLYPVKIYLTAMVLGLSLSLPLAIIVTYTAYLVSMLPITPGGLGTFEGSMTVILSLNGFLLAEGMAIALLARSITYWFPLFISAGAAIYLIKNRDIKMPSNIFSRLRSLTT